MTRSSTVLRRAAAAALCALSVSAAPALADAPGALDTSFGTSGWATAPLEGTLGVAGGVVVQPDGKIVTGGMFRNSIGKDMVMATRMLPDGRLDPSFGQNGIFTLAVGVGSCANTLRLQSDGKIVLAGVGSVDGKMQFLALRLLPDGTPDPGFGANGVATAPVGAAAIANGVAIQDDGKVVLGGTARTVLSDASTNRFAVARFNADGTRDVRFGTDGSSIIDTGAPAAAWGMALQADGKLVLGGQAQANGTDIYMGARVTSNGRLDNRFGTNGVVTKLIGTKSIANAIAVQPDGRILLTGNAFDGRGVAATWRLKTDGTSDTTFGTAGVSEVTLWQAVNGVALQPDGKIVLASTGSTTTRLRPDGSPDPTFGTNGQVTYKLGTQTAANGVAIQQDGKIVLAGTATTDTGRPLTVFRLWG